MIYANLSLSFIRNSIRLVLLKYGIIFSTALLAFCFVKPASGQQAPSRWMEAIPKMISPHAYEFTKYGDVPVSTYTGVPNISIPIYTIKAAGLDVPIAVSYHSNGIKVNEEASWVGLGFSLEAGGNIVQVVNQYDDFGGNAGYLDPANLSIQIPSGVMDCTSGGVTENIHDQGGVHPFFTAGLWDTQPDIFIFNFLTYSGQFVYDRKLQQFTSLQDPNILITSDDDLSQPNQLQSFEIRVPEGHKFHFALKEVTTIDKINGWTAPENSGAFGPVDLRGSAASRLFQLQAIYTNLGEEILFAYKQTETITNYPSVSQVNVKNTLDAGSVHNSGPYSNQIFPANSTTINMSATSQRLSYLDYVKTDKVRIDFVSSANRADMQGAYRLDQILVRDNILDGAVRKTFDFTYDYFAGILQGNTIDEYFDDLDVSKSDNEKRLRLKLMSIKEAGSPPFEFSYSDVALPGKTSLAYDHWGFFNGAYGSSLTNRTDANRNFTHAAILTAIKYPTDGTTVLEYEPNEVSDEIKQTPVYKKETGTVRVNDQNYGADIPGTFGPSVYRTSPRSFWIIVTKNSDVSYHPVLSVQGSCSATNMTATEFLNASWEIRSYKNTALDKVNQQGWAAIPSFVSDQAYINYISVNRVPNEGPNSSKFKDFGNRSIGPGLYFFSVNLDDACGPQNVMGEHGLAGLVLDYSQDVVDYYETRKEIGAGIRVKSMKDYESTGNAAKARQFVYDDPILMSDPQYTAQDEFYYDYDHTYMNADEEVFCQEYRLRGVSQSTFSNSVLAPSTNASGKYVGYGKVEEYLIDVKNNNSASNGRKVTYYTNSADERPPAYRLPGWRRGRENGLVEKEQYMDTGGSVIKEISYQYEAVNRPCYVAAKTYWTKRLYYFSWECSFHYKDYYAIGFYPIVRSKTYLKKITTTFRQGDEFLTEEEDLTYDDHNQVRRSAFEDSEGNVYETYNTFPYDYISTTNAVPGKMVNAHHIAEPVSVEIRKNTQRINFVRSDFQVIGTASSFGDHEFFGKSAVFNQNGNGSEEKVVEFQRYDKDKILQYITTDGVVTALIWGYKNQCVVAKIAGATYDEAIGLVDRNLLNQPANNTALLNELDKIRVGLPKAFVTTYAHDMVYGITAERDANGQETRYLYDPYGRLNLIIDKEGNIERMYSYGFRK